MGRLIDTSILIDLERASGTTSHSLFDLSDGSYFISVVTMSEMLVGSHRGRDDRREKRRAFADYVLGEVAVLAIDETIARLHARLTADLLSFGKPPAMHDLWIAATAIRHDLEVLTRDTHSFPYIPGLRLVAMP